MDSIRGRNLHFRAFENLTKNFTCRLAAYYHNGRGESGFICGGSLVSTKIVITAAHCIHYKFDTLVRKAEDALFYIGKHNIAALDGEQNFIISGVTQLIVHPDWKINTEDYDADIGIAVLFKTVTFSKFVKTICLWTATSTYSDLVGKQGIVAGWGKNEFNAISTIHPMWTRVTVVDELTCRRSNNFLGQLLSERTFCAGDKNSFSGPCNGDSGEKTQNTN